MKDLAKALAVKCVVFNCSESLGSKLMGRLFAGIAQSGSWLCFDDFQRINVVVASVIAQQLMTIRNAKAMKTKRFIFENREIKLVLSCHTFITMSPNSATRDPRLPINLKVQFRPIALMAPDLKIIATVVLYFEGFERSNALAQKLTQVLKFSQELLSSSGRYDFGLRAMKVALREAGIIRRTRPHQSEDTALASAIYNSSVPKLQPEDMMRNMSAGIEGRLAVFEVASLAGLDPMYQFSFGYFSRVFCKALLDENRVRIKDFQQRLQLLVGRSTRRGL